MPVHLTPSCPHSRHQRCDVPGHPEQGWGYCWAPGRPGPALTDLPPSQDILRGLHCISEVAGGLGYGEWQAQPKGSSATLGEEKPQIVAPGTAPL